MSKLLGGILGDSAPAGCCGWCDVSLKNFCCVRSSDGRIGQYVYGGGRPPPAAYQRTNLERRIEQTAAQVEAIRRDMFAEQQARSLENMKAAVSYATRHGCDYPTALAAVRAGKS